MTSIWPCRICFRGSEEWNRVEKNSDINSDNNNNK